MTTVDDSTQAGNAGQTAARMLAGQQFAQQSGEGFGLQVQEDLGGAGANHAQKLRTTKASPADRVEDGRLKVSLSRAGGIGNQRGADALRELIGRRAREGCCEQGTIFGRERREAGLDFGDDRGLCLTGVGPAKLCHAGGEGQRVWHGDLAALAWGCAPRSGHLAHSPTGVRRRLRRRGGHAAGRLG